MAVTLNASTASGLIATSDTSGIIQLQSNGSTKATISSSGFSYPGGVLQVVQTVKTDTFSTTSTTDTLLTGLTASITPSSSSNKIMVIVEIGASATFNNDFATYFSLYRNSSVITGARGTQVGSSRKICSFGSRSATFNQFAAPSMNYLDSPATTSATTYQVYVATENASSGGSYINTSGSSSDSVSTPLTISTITLMEIGV